MITVRTTVVVGAGTILTVGAILVWTGKLDDEAPGIELSAPDEVVRGPVQIAIRIEDEQPGVGTAFVQVDDHPPEPLHLDDNGQAVWSIPAQPTRDGLHTVTVSATDGAWTANAAEATITYTTDHTPPVLEWALIPTDPAQGEVVALFVRASEALSESVFSGLEQTRPLRPVADGTLRGLVGLGVKTPAGPHTLAVEAADPLGNTTRCALPIMVRETHFPRGGTIRLSNRQVAARRDTEALAKMRRDRTAAYVHVDPVAHWSGGAVRPVTGRRTSAFGRYRTYSDGRKKHHLGTDLANITGTPVHAALSGVVRAAGWQHLFGNAVIVHHGQGLTTSYNHLSRVDVQVGDAVEAGDLVGAIGSTGQSTGPHLHWGMQVGEVEVDPERWPDHGFAPTQLAAPISWALATDCTPLR